VQDATQAYRDEMDTLARFLSERCIEKTNAQAGATPLYNAYKQWCEESGERWETRTSFGLRLTERGYTKKRDAKGAILYCGLGLRSEGSEGSEDLSGKNTRSENTSQKRQNNPSDYSDPSESDIQVGDLCCSVCGANVEFFSADGVPYCDEHWRDAALEEGAAQA
jgi:phage/plasmid-associated DNA primase